MTEPARGREILYVTRKFPPSVGGMELLAKLVDDALHGLRPTFSVTLGRSQRHLVWFLPFAAARSASRIARRDVEWVVCGDAIVLAALWPVLRRGTVKVAVIIHGLDLVFPSRIYRVAIRRALERADRVIAISSATAEQAAKLGVDRKHIAIVRPGLPHVPHSDRNAAGLNLRTRLNLPESSVLILTVGRLVLRKGVRFFVGEVMPDLPSHVHYLVAGDGPERERKAIEWAASDAKVADRVHLLGRVSDSVRDALFDGTDIFVVPNLPVSGDMEGFGLVALEAVLRGVPVVAARLDGLQDAVLDGRTGWLCTPAVATDWLRRLTPLVNEQRSTLRHIGEQFRQEAERQFQTERMHAELADALGLE